MKTKKQTTLSVFLLLLITLSCTSYEKKKMPSEGQWEECRRCRGYGVVEESYTKKSPKGRDREKDENRSCMLFPFMATDQYEKFEEHAEARQITDQNPRELPYRPHMDTQTKRVKCHVCGGIGWNIIEEHQESIIIKKKTEMYDFELK